MYVSRCDGGRSNIHIGGNVENLKLNEGIIAGTWIKCQEGIHECTVYFWHTQGLSVRNEELMKVISRSASIRWSHWIIVRDANLETMQFRLGERYGEGEAQVKVSAWGVSTYRAKGEEDEEIDKVQRIFVQLFGSNLKWLVIWLQTAQTGEVRNQTAQRGQVEWGTGDCKSGRAWSCGTDWQEDWQKGISETNWA